MPTGGHRQPHHSKSGVVVECGAEGTNIARDAHWCAQRAHSLQITFGLWTRFVVYLVAFYPKVMRTFVLPAINLMFFKEAMKHDVLGKAFFCPEGCGRPL